jgi:hypothetical protein
MRTAGGAKADQAWTVVTDAQGNLYWGTHQQATGELYTDMVVYKIAPDGTQLWERRWGGKFQEKWTTSTSTSPAGTMAPV